jgi:hypothetical protein
LLVLLLQLLAEVAVAVVLMKVTRTNNQLAVAEVNQEEQMEPHLLVRLDSPFLVRVVAVAVVAVVDLVVTDKYKVVV